MRAPVIVSFAILLLLLLVIGTCYRAPEVTYRSIWIGNRPATLATAWRPWIPGQRALIVSPAVTDDLRSRAIQCVTLNRYGLYLNGSLVKKWNQSYIVVVCVDQAGATVIHDVKLDQRRLVWLNSENLAADQIEIQRLDADCARLGGQVARGNSRGQDSGSGRPNGKREIASPGASLLPAVTRRKN